MADHDDRSRVRLLAGVATASGAALVAATLATATPRTVTGLALGALAAGFVFEGIALLGGPRPPRRARRVTGVWNAPLLAAAVAFALGWRALGTRGGLVFAIAIAVTLAVIACWAAPTWSSRVLQPLLQDRSPRHIMTVLVLMSATAVLAAVVATTRADHADAVTWGWMSVGLAEAVTAATAIGVHQWRFAPRARACALGVLLTASALLLLVAPSLLIDDGHLAGPASVAGLLVVVLLLARRPARLARDSAPVRAPTPTRVGRR
jgi:hypothetical protein